MNEPDVEMGILDAGAESPKIEMDSLEDSETSETISVIEPVKVIDYTGQLSDISVLLTLIIFFIGVICGIVCGKIMWERVKI